MLKLRMQLIEGVDGQEQVLGQAEQRFEQGLTPTNLVGVFDDKVTPEAQDELLFTARMALGSAVAAASTTPQLQSTKQVTLNAQLSTESNSPAGTHSDSMSFQVAGTPQEIHAAIDALFGEEQAAIVKQRLGLRKLEGLGQKQINIEGLASGVDIAAFDDETLTALVEQLSDPSSCPPPQPAPDAEALAASPTPPTSDL